MPESSSLKSRGSSTTWFVDAASSSSRSALVFFLSRRGDCEKARLLLGGAGFEAGSKGRRIVVGVWRLGVLIGAQLLGFSRTYMIEASDLIADVEKSFLSALARIESGGGMID